MNQGSNKISRLREKGMEFENEIRNKILGYVVASFGLVAGLAWNEAIKAFIEAFFPVQKDTLYAKFIYAFLVTIALVFISLYLTKIFKRKEKEGLVKEGEKLAKP